MNASMPAAVGNSMLGGGWLSPLRPHSSGGLVGASDSSMQHSQTRSAASVQAYLPNLSNAMAHEVSDVSDGAVRPPKQPSPEKIRHVPFWGTDMLGQAHKAEFATKLASAATAAHEAAHPTTEAGGALRNTRFVPNGSTLSLNLKSDLEGHSSVDDMETSLTGFPLTALERSRQLSRGSQNIAGFSNSKGLLFGKTRAEAFLTHLRTGVDTLSRSIRKTLKDFADSDSDEDNREQSAMHQFSFPSGRSTGSTPRSQNQKASVLQDAASSQLLASHAAAVAQASQQAPSVLFGDLNPSKQAALHKIVDITAGFERSYKAIAFVVWAEEAVRRQRQEQREFIARCRATDKFRRVFVKMWHRSVGPRFVHWKRHAWRNIESLHHAAAKSIQATLRSRFAKNLVQRMREQRASTRIQAAVRMTAARAKYPHKLRGHKELAAALDMQRIIRGGISRVLLKRRVLRNKQQQAAKLMQALFRGRQARRRTGVMRSMSKEILETQQAIISAKKHAKEQAALAASAKAELEKLVSLTRDRRKAELRAKAEAEKTVVLEKAKRGQERMTREALRAAERVAAERTKTEAAGQKVAEEAEEASIAARDSAVALLAHRKRAEVRHVAAMRIQNTFRGKQQRDLERLQAEIASGVSDNAALKRTMTAMKKTDEVAQDTLRKMGEIEKAVLVAGDFIRNAVRSVQEEASQGAVEAEARRQAAEARLSPGGRRRSISPKRSQSPTRRGSFTTGSISQDTKAEETKADETEASNPTITTTSEARPSDEIANEKRILLAKAQTIQTGQGAIDQLQATIRSLQSALKKERAAAQKQISALETRRVNGAREVERAILATLADPAGMSKQLEAQTDGREHFRKYQSALTREFRKLRRRKKRFGTRMLRFRKQVQPWDYKFKAEAGARVPPQPKWIKFYEPAADALYFFNTTTMERRWTKPTHGDGYSTSDTEASDDDMENAPWAVGGTSEKRSDQLRTKALVESMDPTIVAAQNARWKAYACAECAANKSTRRCDQCGESYCDRCHSMLHKRGRRAFHTWKAVRPWMAVEHAGAAHHKDACSDCRAAPSTRKCLQCCKDFCGTCYELTHRTDVMKNKHSWTHTEHGRRIQEERDRKNGKNETVFAAAADREEFDGMSYIPEGDDGASVGYAGGGLEAGEVEYDANGGYYDEYGGYVDAEGGYTDAEGNYTAPDGVYHEAAAAE
mgnify:CR=1 FL=1